MVASGSGSLQVGNRRHALAGGTVVVCPAHSPLVLQSDSADTIRGYRIGFRALGLQEAGEDRPCPSPLPVPYMNKAPFRAIELGSELHALWNSGQAPYKMLACFFDLLHELNENCSRSEPDNKIERTTAYMKEHYDEELSRELLANVAGVSLDYFSSWFKKETGQTYTDYLARIRIDRACERLLTSKSPVCEIAREAGFRDEGYFSRKFKKRIGVAPSAYVRMPKKIVSLSANCTAFMLSLGVVPVAAVVSPWIHRKFQRYLAETPKLAYAESALDTGLLGQAHPDLFLCYDLLAEADILRDWAPVVLLKLADLSWRDQLLLIADLTQSTEKARVLLNRYDEKVASCREQLADVIGEHETVISMEIFPHHIYPEFRK